MGNNSQSFMPKLIFLCIITTSIATTLSFSKYQSTVIGTSNTATVSKPVLNVRLAENQEESLTIDCNSDKTATAYNLIVSNNETNNTSEVSLKYDIILTLPTSAPNGLDIKIDGKDATKNGNIYTIQNAGQFSPSAANEKTHTLTFEVNPDIVRNCNLENIKITVYAEQID